jgi:hypothetical protein
MNPSAAIVPIASVFSSTDRLALAGFLALYRPFHYQRLLAMATCIWHNANVGAPRKRSLIACGH